MIRYQVKLLSFLPSYILTLSLRGFESAMIRGSPRTMPKKLQNFARDCHVVRRASLLAMTLGIQFPFCFLLNIISFFVSPMHFQDITHNPETHYRIDQPGEWVFFFVHRNGALAFEVAHSQACIRVIGLFRGREKERFSLSTTQHHTTPGARSEVIIRSALSDRATLEHNGTIRIEPEAQHTHASLESRHLLLDSQVHASAKPQLEILADDVSCSHAVTTSPLNPELLAYLTSRSLNSNQAAQLLTQGFLTAPTKNLPNDIDLHSFLG